MLWVKFSNLPFRLAQNLLFLSYLADLLSWTLSGVISLSYCLATSLNFELKLDVIFLVIVESMIRPV